MKKLLLLFTIALSYASAQQAPRPFELPVTEKAFDIENRHLLEIGERALRPEERMVALRSFYELRTKLSAEFMGKSDYYLASVLLAESCLLFPKESKVPLTIPNKGTVDVSKLASEILLAPMPATISQEVTILWSFVLARFYIIQQNFTDSSQTIAKIWEPHSHVERLTQLADLYNWILLTYTQALSAHAEEMRSDSTSVDIWNHVVKLCEQYKPNLNDLLKTKSAEDIAKEKVTNQAGEQLHRSPRCDIMEADIVRIKTRALLMLKRYREAEAELKKDCMAHYALERRLLSLVSIANQGRLEDAQKHYEQCLPDIDQSISNGNSYAPEWHQVLWTMFNMYYEHKRFEEADDFLLRLEPLLSQGERLEWLKLRLELFQNELNDILLQTTNNELNAEQKARISEISDQCMKYAVIFPDACNKEWADFIQSLTEEFCPIYYDHISEVLLLLGKAQCLTGNFNSAFELFENIGQNPVFSDVQRYKAYMQLGETAESNGALAIKAFKACETLKENNVEQIALALFKAAERAQKLSRSPSTPDHERQTMADETVALYTRLSTTYSKTVHGREASFSLGEFLYSQRKYADAAQAFKIYFGQNGIDNRKLTQAKLLWCRAVRLNAEQSPVGAKKNDADMQEAYALTTAMLSEPIDNGLKRQTYLEAYRIAATQNDFTAADSMLDTLISESIHTTMYDTPFWIALYERILNRYQHSHLEDAEEDAELFLKLHAQNHNTTLETDYFTLLGDLYARLKKWDSAAEMYRHIEHIIDRKQPKGVSIMNYAMYEAAYCLFMKGDCTTSAQLLKTYFPANAVSDKHYAYESALLLGDIMFADNNSLEAYNHYARAQQIYGNEDTYKTNYAMCRQAEMLIVSAENAMAQGKSQQVDIPRNLQQACDMFASLLDSPKQIDQTEKDHYFDLSIRAQYDMGECYELSMPNAAADSTSRDAALACYRRVCSYFVTRKLADKPIRNAHYYIKSLEKIVKLLTNGNASVKTDTMREVALRYEEYAKMDLPGSEIARQRAQNIRRHYGLDK